LTSKGTKIKKAMQKGDEGTARRDLRVSVVGGRTAEEDDAFVRRPEHDAPAEEGHDLVHP
jgi:hypothetical protein